MPMLGDLLAAARDKAGDVEIVLDAAEPKLAADFRAAAVSQEISPALLARSAVSDFARFASEEDWATLVSAMREAQDPGTACLAAMVHWRLTAHRCKAHSNA